MTTANPSGAAAAASPTYGQLAADVAVAARIVAPTFPLRTFVAVNPLHGLVDEPFVDAASTAAATLGARTLPAESWMREQWRRGRITNDDLMRALARHAPTALAHPPIQLGNGDIVEAETVLLAELHQGLIPPAPQRTARTVLESLAPGEANRLDTHTVSWCAAYLDEGQAAWRMPHRHAGLYTAWRALVGHSADLPRTTRARLRALPDEPDRALLEALAELEIPKNERVQYLQAHLACLPGWAARIRGHAEKHPDAASDLLGYLALRVATEAALVASCGIDSREIDWDSGAVTTHCGREVIAAVTQAERAAHLLPHLGATPADRQALPGLTTLLALLPLDDRALIWLEAYEGHYRDQLLTTLNHTHRRATTGRPAAQVVCCIDPRSEGLRRHLENRGPYQTLGFAGFFAIALRFADLAGGAPRDHCPAIASPQVSLSETASRTDQKRAETYLRGRRTLAGAEYAWHAAKANPVAPFALADATGWFAGPLSAARTVAPRSTARLLHRLGRRIAPPPDTSIAVDDLSDEQRLLTAHTLLSLMGLTDDFARLVLFVGHAAHTTNNPYQAALDCGACGGHSGGPNARTAAVLLNDPQVRVGLATHGITIPPTTHFHAAEHNTTTDTVTLVDRHLIPDTHARDAENISADLERACGDLAVERCAVLPASPSRHRRGARRHTAGRAADWAQPFPEWGLAGNAAIVIAPRTLTQGHDLDRRVFLHDYDYTRDPDGTVLETILTAPLIVAQWINSQYYFATVDPVIFGAGTKAVHNVVGGGQGVLRGPSSDLQLGLPWQSLTDGHHLRHEPQRLLTLVCAPLDRIDTLIDRHQILANLIHNNWITLMAYEESTSAQSTGRWRRRTPTEWQSYVPQESTR